MTKQEHQENGNGAGDKIAFQQSQGPVGQQFGKPAIDPIELERGDQDESPEIGKQEMKKSGGLGREATPAYHESSHDIRASGKSQHGGGQGEQMLYQQSQGPEGQQFGKPVIDPVEIEHRQEGGKMSSQSRGEFESPGQQEHGEFGSRSTEWQQAAPSREFHSSTGSGGAKTAHRQSEENQKTSPQQASSKKQSQRDHPPHGKHNKDHSHDQDKTPKESKWAQSAIGSENQADHGESKSPFNHFDNKTQKDPDVTSKTQPNSSNTPQGSHKVEKEKGEKSSREDASSISRKPETKTQKPVDEETTRSSQKADREAQSSDMKGSGSHSENKTPAHQGAAEQSQEQATKKKDQGGSPKKVEPFERETHKFEDDSEKTHQDTKWAQSALGNENQFGQEDASLPNSSPKHEGKTQEHGKKDGNATSKKTQVSQHAEAEAFDKQPAEGLGEQSSKGPHQQPRQAQGGSSKNKVEPFERETHRFEDDFDKTHEDTKWAQSALGNEKQFDDTTLPQKGSGDNVRGKTGRADDGAEDEGSGRGDAGVDPLKVIGGGLAGVAATAAGAGVIGTVAGAAAGAAGASKLGDKMEEHEARKAAAA